MLTIDFKTRDMKVKPDTVRRAGSIPAVFYGPKEASQAITINAIQFKKIWKEAGESSVISLTNGTEEHEALIHDVTLHPVSDLPLHADFYVIEKGKKLQIKVPLEYVGTSPAVKDSGLILVKVLHEVEIEAMPKDLPRELQVDISTLVSADSQVLAKDIKMPAGVIYMGNPEDVVAAIAVPKEEVEEVVTKTIDDIEVVGAKGKEEPAEGEAPAEEAK